MLHQLIAEDLFIGQNIENEKKEYRESNSWWMDLSP